MTDGRGGSGDSSSESRWWYWIVLTPFFSGALTLAGFGLVATILLGESTDLIVFAPALLILGLLGAVFAVAFPVSLYKDAVVLGEGGQGWEPNGRRYAAAGLISVVTGFVLAIPLSLYYLSKRREHVGVP